jgi:hypothetical protein
LSLLESGTTLDRTILKIAVDFIALLILRGGFSRKVRNADPSRRVA